MSTKPNPTAEAMPTTLEIVQELSPIIGGRIQKVDLVDEHTFVMEVRCPGRTVRVLISTVPGLGRIHAVDTRPPKQVTGMELQKLLRQRLSGLPLVGLSVQGQTLQLDTPKVRLMIRLEGGKNAFKFLPPAGLELPTPQELPERFEHSERLAQQTAETGTDKRDAHLRSRLLKILKPRKKKLTRLIQKVEQDRTRLLAMKEDAHWGELLKPMLGRIQRGASSAKVYDWQSQSEREVPLDPALSAKDNMERYFKRAKKGVRGLPLTEARLAQLTQKREAIEARAQAIHEASGDALVELARNAEAQRPTVQQRPGAQDKSRPIDRWSRRFVAEDGVEIRVGKGAKENDRLTFQGARGDDIWMHARGLTGAHVILRNEKGRSPSTEAMLDAAHLAVFYSSAKREHKAEVVYTQARNVRKNKGDPPGRVGVTKGQTMLVTMEAKRLDRLLGREGIGHPESGR